MIKIHRKTLLIPFILLIVGNLSACSVISKLRGTLSDDGGINYQNNKSVKQLEVPPDLTQPEFDSAFDLPTGVVSAVSLQNGTSSNYQSVSNTRSTNSNVGVVRRGDLSSVRTVSGRTVLQVNDTYPRSLILTEIMLTRMGFSTLSKSPSGDAITAQYNGPDVTVDGKRRGFFSKAKSLVGLGGSNKALSNGKSYRFTIKNEQGAPIVRVSPVAGKNLSDAAHAKVITLLNNSFNR